MFPLESFQTTLQKFVAILERHNISFHVTGGATAVAHGEPRFTQDIDLVINNDDVTDRLKSFLASLEESDFIADRSTIAKAISAKEMFQLYDSIESLKLDIYPRELIPGELSRSIMAEIFEGVRIPIVCRADAVVSKLIWISKGSHKSRRDVKQIYRRCDDVDLRLINELTDQLDLGELLKTVLAEPDEIE